MEKEKTLDSFDAILNVELCNNLLTSEYDTL